MIIIFQCDLSVKMCNVENVFLGNKLYNARLMLIISLQWSRLSHCVILKKTEFSFFAPDKPFVPFNMKIFTLKNGRILYSIKYS